MELHNNQTHDHATTSMKLILLVFAVILVGALGYFIRIQNSATEATNETSSSVKTTPTKTANWKTYTNNSGVKFTFLYPSEATIPSTTVKGNAETLSVNTPITVVSTSSDIPPAGFTKTEMTNDRTAIANNDPTVGFGSALTQSYKMITNAPVKGKSYMTLAEIEICDVQFSRYGHFYIGPNNDYLVVLTWQDFRINAIEAANPTYFEADSVNCGGKMRWKEGAQETFYSDLVAGKIDALTQAWYKDFDTITSTFKVTN